MPQLKSSLGPCSSELQVYGLKVLHYCTACENPVNLQRRLANWQGNKVVLKQYSSNERDLNQMNREIRILKHLECKSVVEVKSMFIDGPNVFVEMPFYSGGTINSWFQSRRENLIREGKFKEEILRISNEILNGLNHLHSNKVQSCYFFVYYNIFFGMFNCCLFQTKLLLEVVQL